MYHAALHQPFHKEHPMKPYVLGIPLIVVAFAAGISAQAEQKLSGHLVDTVCAVNHFKEPGYAENHANACNLHDSCIKSGFSLMTADRRVLKFDAKGAEQALALVKSTKKEKDVKVTVVGKVDGETLTVRSITLQ
jgi:hypothetical protein